MLNKQKVWIGMLGMAAAVALAGCSTKGEPNVSSPDPSPGSSSSSPSSSPVKTNEPVELVFYTMNADDEAFFNGSMADGLRKKFPHFTIKYINSVTGGSIDNMMLNNTHFDLYFSTAGRPEQVAFQKGFAYDMSEMLKKHQVDLNQFDPAFKESLGPAYGGRTFSLPYRADSLLMYYNKDIFDRFGAAYLKDGMTWDDVYAVARKLTRLENGVQYVGYKPNISGLIRSNPLPIPLVQTGTLAPTINTDSRWRTFFQKFLVDAVPASDIEVINKYGSDYTGFITGTLGIYIGSDSSLAPQAIPDFANIKYDIASLPTLKESPGIGAQPFSYNIGISNKAKNKDAAMEAVKYIVSAEHQMELSKFGRGTVLKDPAIRKAQGSGLPHLKDKNLKALSYNKWADVTYFGVTSEPMRAVYAKHLGKFITEGQSDFNTLFRQAEEEAVKSIEDLKKTIVVDGTLR